MSDAKIYLVDPGHKRLLPMNAARYLTEDELQTYLADYAGLLPGDQINPEAPRRWLLVARELGVPDTSQEGTRWSLDHLFLDQDGTPTFVECKRASDTRTRREVVAQMLDYAANGTAYWKVDHLRQAAAETAACRGADLDDLIRELIGPDGVSDVDAFWREVERRLAAGQVRLLFVVDEAPSELRRLAEFLNDKMSDVEVLIVEIKQYQGEGHTALSPLVLGITEAVRSKKSASSPARPRLTPEALLAAGTPVQQQVTQFIWRIAGEHGCTLNWAATCYSVRARHPVTREKLSFLYGYPASFNFYFDFLALPAEAAAALRRELLDSGIFRPSGLHTLEGVRIDEQNVQ